MNKRMRVKLRSAFEPPVPSRRNAFLMAFNYPQAGRFGFVLMQFSYIRKRVWVVSSMLIVVLMLILHSYVDESSINAIRFISAALPFVTLTAVIELARSAAHNMDELEMSCKYCLADITLARLGILGGTHLLVFAVCAALLAYNSDFNILRITVYALAPFLLTCLLSLMVINRQKSRETIYICGGAACAVSLLCVMLNAQSYSEPYLSYWAILCVIALPLVIRETLKMIHETEEYRWNLS